MISHTFYRQQRGVVWKNVDPSPCPAYGIIQVDGWEELPGERFAILGKRPFSTGGLYIVNRERIIVPSDVGMATIDDPLKVLVQEAGLEPGDVLGPVEDSWIASKDGTGFKAIGDKHEDGYTFALRMGGGGKSTIKKVKTLELISRCAEADRCYGLPPEDCPYQVISQCPGGCSGSARVYVNGEPTQETLDINLDWGNEFALLPKDCEALIQYYEDEGKWIVINAPLVFKAVTLDQINPGSHGSVEVWFKGTPIPDFVLDVWYLWMDARVEPIYPSTEIMVKYFRDECSWHVVVSDC